MPLNLLGIGEEAVVKKSFFKEELKRKLKELGIVEGAKIKVLNETGSNIILMIMDSRLAINKDIARKIIVEAC